MTSPSAPPPGHPYLGPDPVEGIVVVSAQAVPTAVTSYIGPYEGLGEEWGRMMGEIAARGLAPGMPCWESYVTDPTPDTDPATLRTDLYCLVADPSDAA